MGKALGGFGRHEIKMRRPAPDDGADGDDAVVFAGGRPASCRRGAFEGAGNADVVRFSSDPPWRIRLVSRAADEPVHNEIVETCRKDGEFEIRRVEMPVDGLDLVHGSLVCMG